MVSRSIYKVTAPGGRASSRAGGLLCRFCVGLIALIVSSASFAQDYVPPMEDWLAGAGYASGQYESLIQWSESANDGSQVFGVRIIPEGDEARDVYFTTGGDLLDTPALRVLGVASKRWDAGPRQAYAETYIPPPSAVAQTRKATRQPAATPSEVVTLPPLDLGQIAYEDALSETDGKASAERIGVFQSLPEPVFVTEGIATHGTWETGADGAQVWSLAIDASGAVGQRVHITELYMPGGAELIVYNAADTSETYGPFTEIPEGEIDWWTPTCYGATIVLEVRIIPGADAAGLSLAFDQIIHMYKGADEFTEKRAGDCNLDVACYDEYATTARGIVGLGSIATTGALFCSGTLIADSDAETQIPYILSANHCFGSYSPSSTEVYWFYQRETCGGTLPGIRSVPRSSSGLELLARAYSSNGTDVILMRMRDMPPAMATFVGWSTFPWQPGTAVTGIHHPSGSYKRISFGDVTDGPSRLRPIERYHEVLWSDGTTEPGSSGSPIVLQETQQIIGQLYGGNASCVATEEPDYYGRFDVSYALLGPWLAPPPDPADVNRDYELNAEDIQLVINVVLGKTSEIQEADVDESGFIDAVDIQLVINAVLMQ